MNYIRVRCSACATLNQISDRKQHLKARCGKCREAISIGAHAVPVVLDDTSMDAFLQSTGLPVLVDFFSPICGPCTTLAPLLDSLAKQFLGRVVVAKVDTGMNPGCTAHFHIKGVPTLIFFKDGREVEQLVGLPDKNHLLAKMEYYAR